MLKNLIISLVGPEKSGKTDWALSAPKKIAHEEFDIGGLDRAGWRWQDEINKGLIVPRRFTVEADKKAEQESIALASLKTQLSTGINPSAQNKRVIEGDLKGVKELWYRFLQEYVEDISNPDVRTVVIDSATQMWQVCHGALLQEKQEAARAASGGNSTRERLTQIEYGTANKRFEPVIWAAREMQKNLILIHHETEERKDMPQSDGTVAEGVPTGRMVPEGWRHVKKNVDLEVWVRLEQREKPREQGKKREFETVRVAEIKLSGVHRDAVGMAFTDSGTQQKDMFDTMMKSIRLLRGEPVG